VQWLAAHPSARSVLWSAVMVQQSTCGPPCWGRSGFARFTNAPYSNKKEDITNTFIHLTNVAVQKHAPNYDSSKGMKWAIRSLRLFMTTKHGACASAYPRRSLQLHLVPSSQHSPPSME
jgi:tubulin polyglutamylase TTLL9